jgi:hypothetical protein
VCAPLLGGIDTAEKSLLLLLSCRTFPAHRFLSHTFPAVPFLHDFPASNFLPELPACHFLPRISRRCFTAAVYRMRFNIPNPGLVSMTVSTESHFLPVISRRCFTAAIYCMRFNIQNPGLVSFRVFVIQIRKSVEWPFTVYSKQRPC